MTRPFEELAYSKTPMGELTLRRRRLPTDDQDIYEIKLGEHFLMSSVFTAGEIALANIALKDLTGLERDVLVGGLGLGFTARAVLRSEGIRSVVIVERFEEVIEWHLKEVVPAGRTLAGDARCEIVHDDFFAAVSVPFNKVGREWNSRKFHAILVDIDHSPSHLLSKSHASFYTNRGLGTLETYLHPGGVFALWSNDPPDDAFLSQLRSVFRRADAKVVAVDNPQQNLRSFNTIYLGYARHELPRSHRAPPE